MERTYFFDSTEQDERIYNAADFARFHAQIIGNGVSNTANLPDLEVTAQNNMNVGLGAGYMFANGYMYENTSTLTLTHDTADSNNDRIDRVVIRFDANPEERSIKAVILKGTPANTPVPPALTRDNYIYEMSVAQVRIIKGKSFIEQSQITDERANYVVCGYIPLHNIYRGLEINEHGMVTMPNQSFVDVRADDANYEIKYDSFEEQLPINHIITDRQGEISNNAFIPKADGVFHIWMQIRCAESVLRNMNIGSTHFADIQAYADINNTKPDLPIGANVVMRNTDNIWTFSQPIPLKKGDVLKLFTKYYNPGGQNIGGIPVENVWVRIFKVS